MKKILITISILLGLSGVAYAAPTLIYQRTLLPETDSTYNLGSSTNRWANIYTDDLVTTDMTVDSLTATLINASTTNSDVITVGSYVNYPLTLGTSSPPELQFEYDTNTGLGWIADDKMGLYTGGTSRLTIDASGNVGIGTTSPGTLLHVQGAATILQNYPLKLRNDTGTVGFGGGLRYDTQSGETLIIGVESVATKIMFATGHNIESNQGTANQLPASPELTIYNGNLGIGTTSPAYLLDVDGGFRVGTSTQANQLVVNANSGNVGIGTAAPDNLLTITGGDAHIWDDSSLGSELNTVANATSPINETDATTGWVNLNGELSTFESATEGGEPSGTYSLHTQQDGMWERAYTDITVTAGGFYKVVVVVKEGPSLGSGVALELGTSVDTDKYDSENIPQSWTTITKYITIDSATTTLRISLLHDGGWHHGQIYLDTLSVKEVIGGDLIARGALTGGGTSGIKILADGNVGIGTTSPDYKFQVNGDIVSDLDNTDDLGKAGIRWANVWATLVNGADFVFNNDFRLTECDRIDRPNGDCVLLMDSEDNVLQVWNKGEQIEISPNEFESRISVLEDRIKTLEENQSVLMKFIEWLKSIF